MEQDAATESAEVYSATPGMPGAAPAAPTSLLDRLSLIEAQPLGERARVFEQLHNELLAELQRSDREGA